MAGLPGTAVPFALLAVSMVGAALVRVLRNPMTARAAAVQGLAPLAATVLTAALSG